MFSGSPQVFFIAFARVERNAYRLLFYNFPSALLAHAQGKLSKNKVFVAQDTSGESNELAFFVELDNLSLISADFEQTVRLAELNPIKKVRSR